MNYEKPINEGDILDVKIESTGAKGDGIAKIDNFVIIVPNVREGDQVKIKITRVLNKMAFGEVVDDGEETQNNKEETPVDTPETEEETPTDNPEEVETEEKAEE